MPSSDVTAMKGDGWKMKNEDGVVKTLISREKFFAKKSRQFVPGKN